MYDIRVFHCACAITEGMATSGRRGPTNISPAREYANFNDFVTTIVHSGVSKWTELNSSMKEIYKKVKLLSIVGGIFLLTATACKLDENDAEPLPPVAYVSIYQASPNSPDLNIFLDSKVIDYGFEYTDHTGYLRFITGNRTLQFGPSGADNIVIDTTMKFEEAKAYSVFIVDTYQNADILVLNDDTNAPAAGKAKVRFLNLSPDAQEVSLSEADASAPLFTGLAFKEPSEFVEVDAKKYNFVVKNASGDNVLLSLPNAILLEGFSYTVLVRGFTTPPGGSTSVLSAQLIVD
jgi:hypothetical protein